MLLKSSGPIRAGGIDHGTGWQNEGKRFEGMVGIQGHATAHPAGIIRHDAAHGAGIDRCRIGADFPAVRHKKLVDGPADDAWLYANLVTLRLNAGLTPIPSHFHKDSVSDGLARQARSRAAKCQRHAVTMAKLEQTPDLLNALREHDRFRDEPVKAGIGSESDAVDWPAENSLRLDNFGKLV